MRLSLLCMILPLAAAQFPFILFDVPLSVPIGLIRTVMQVSTLDTQCMRDIKTAFKDLISAGFSAMECNSLQCLFGEKMFNATYPLQMLASTGRPHSLDLDELSVTWAGDPKLCQSVRDKVPYATKYCFVHVNIDYKSINFDDYGASFFISRLPGGKIPEIEALDGTDRCSTMSINNVKLAFCLPASCEKDTEFGRILSDVTNGAAHLCEISCEGPKEEPNTFFYLFNFVLFTLLVIAIFASLLDYWATSEGKEETLKNRAEWKALMSFSIPRNTMSVFSQRKDGDAILCLDALRFISFTWVASLHSLIYSADGDNPIQIFRETNYFFSAIILNSFSSVDTFFLISGLLVSYTFFKKVHRDPEYAYSQYNWIMYYVHRWLRLTPAYLLFIGLYVAWTPRMHGVWAAGAALNSSYFVQNCQDHWWMNALYVNNFDSMFDMCYPISWFLAVDMQLYCIAPLFLVAIYNSWKTGFVAVLGGVVVSIVTNVFITAYFNLPATMFFIGKNMLSLDYVNQIYIKPWTRCIPYLTGILCGYLIIQVRKKNLEIKRPKSWQLIMYWMLATVSALTVIFSVYNYMRGHSDWDIIARSFYGCFSRIGWSAAVAWVVLACTFDWAGPVKTLLEHPLWYPLGRLSYCAFLTHWFILHLLFNGEDRLAHFYLTVTIPVVFLSCILAYVWTCLVEIPFGNIEAIVVDILMNRRKTSAHNNLMNGSEKAAQGFTLNAAPAVTSIEVNKQN